MNDASDEPEIRDTEVASGGGSAQARNESLLRAATYASVGVALVLIVVKFGAWLFTDSLSLLSTLIDSFLDAAASLINLYAVRRALRPADDQHRFGHGKAEPLAGLAQAAFISGSAAFLLIEAGERLFRPHVVDNSDLGIAVMIFAIVLTVILVIFQRIVVLRTGSVAIRADSLHYQTDILVNISVIASLLLASEFGWILADPVFAIAIAAYILWGAWRIGKSSLGMLMDRELPEDERQRIRDIAMSHPGVLDLHDMRTRSSGSQVFIQMHLEFDGEARLREVHVISEDVMHEIEAAFPAAEVLIHEDPQGVDEDRSDFD
jgi:ferrous-iron efflux pump FieF